MAQFYIYGLFDPITKELRYIGQTKNPKKRYNQYLKNYYLKGSKKTGKIRYVNNWVGSLIKNNLNPEIQILDKSLDFKEILELEKFYISYFRFLGCKLTNTTDGGEGTLGYKFSEEERKIISERTIEAMKNPEIIKKISDSGKGRIPPNKGKKYSQEICKKISEAKKGKSVGLGRKHSKESKKKMSESKKNYIPWIKGKNHSEKTKRHRQLTDPRNLKVIDNFRIIYISISEASRITGISRKTIHRQLKNKKATRNCKFFFEYYNAIY